MVAEVILAEENKNEGCSAIASQQSERAQGANLKAGRLQDEDPMDPLLKVNKSLNKGVLVHLRSAAAVHIMCPMRCHDCEKDTARIRYGVGTAEVRNGEQAK